MKEWTKEQLENFFDGDTSGYIYFYTPMCGTCQVAGKMLTVIEQLLPETICGKADLNFVTSMAERFQIESVPCLIIQRNGKVQEKVYAFHSVPYLYEKLKNLREIHING